VKPGRVAGLGLVLWQAVAAAEAPVAPAPVRRALIVAYNGSNRPAVRDLRFADDDGVRWLEAFRRLGIEAELLTVPDAETAAASPGLLRGVQEPSRAGVQAAARRLAERIGSDHARGSSVDAYLVYVGHGQTDASGKPSLTLLDGVIDQQALYETLVDPLGADYVHVFVDACHAAGVVGSRGGDAQVLEQLRAALAKDVLARRPRVGALYAESLDGTTHEWSRFRAGVFSHVVRSGLLGGADVNGDGEVSYSELEAFVAASIRGVRTPGGRLQIKAFPPELQPTRPLAGHTPPGPELVLPVDERQERVSVEDLEGTPLLDVNRRGGATLAFALPPRDRYRVRVNAGEFVVAASGLKGPLPEPVPSEVTQRGDADGLLRGLFAVPFDRSFYEGYMVSASDLVPVEFRAEAPPPAPRGFLRTGTFAVGLVVAGAPLGGAGVSGGVELAWRSAPPWFVGMRVGYAYAPDSFSDDSTVHQVSVMVLGGWTGEARWAPFVETGLGWLLTIVPRHGQTQGDPLGWAARLASGVQVRSLPLGVRLALAVELQSVRVDSIRRYDVVPRLELAATF
jgi:hypothetical protein